MGSKFTHITQCYSSCQDSTWMTIFNSEKGEQMSFQEYRASCHSWMLLTHVNLAGRNAVTANNPTRQPRPPWDKISNIISDMVMAVVLCW